MSFESSKKNYDNVTEWAQEANHSNALCLCLISMDGTGKFIVGTIPGMTKEELAKYLDHCVKILVKGTPNVNSNLKLIKP